MIYHYFKIAWRNIAKNRGYSAINILGLSIGMAVCLLILLFVQHELGYDQYHAHAGRIYRADIEIKFGDNHLDLALANPNFGEGAKSEIAAVEDYARIRWYGGLLIKKGKENFREGHVAYADNALFSVFSFTFLDGDPKTALTEPNTIVINESIARKYFNSTRVAGKILTVNGNQTRRISGVIKDIPDNTHFRFRAFIPMLEDEYSKEKTWAGSQNYNTYLLAREGIDAAHLTAELNKMFNRNLDQDLRHILGKSLTEFNSQGDFFKVSLTPLPDIHLHSDKTGELYGGGNLQYIYIFSAIALFVLLIACINFVNLATARMSGRAKEVGLRKCIGALRSGLISQFLLESVLTTAFSMALAVGLAWATLPVFNRLADKEIQAAFLTQPSLQFVLVLLTLAVGLLAGAYPAFYFSAFQPVKVGALGSLFKKSLLRNGLVVFQFMASVVLIVGTILIYQQMDYIRKKDVGYNREQMLIITNTDHLGAQAQSFKNELLAIAGVKNVTVTGFLPTNYYRTSHSFFTNPGLDTKEAISMQQWEVDEDYISTMKMTITAGRNFDKTMGTDKNAIIINETAARFFGDKDVLDKLLYDIEDEETGELRVFKVIGVVKDFNFSSLREKVKPLALLYRNNSGSMAVRLQSSDLHALMSLIEEKWKGRSPDLPFEYTFMDEDFNTFYKGEERMAGILTVFAILALFIGCVGLFGLAAFTAAQRTKEIGIRKILGASVPAVVTLLSKDFLILILVALAVGSPVAYYFMNKWLDNFAYRVSIQWWVFAAAGAATVTVAMLTVSFQAIKAAVANPVESLRSE